MGQRLPKHDCIPDTLQVCKGTWLDIIEYTIAKAMVANTHLPWNSLLAVYSDRISGWLTFSSWWAAFKMIPSTFFLPNMPGMKLDCKAVDIESEVLGENIVH